jgi:hypothetical protein
MLLESESERLVLCPKEFLLQIWKRAYQTLKVERKRSLIATLKVDLNNKVSLRTGPACRTSFLFFGARRRFCTCLSVVAVALLVP